MKVPQTDGTFYRYSPEIKLKEYFCNVNPIIPDLENPDEVIPNQFVPMPDSSLNQRVFKCLQKPFKLYAEASRVKVARNQKVELSIMHSYLKGFSLSKCSLIVYAQNAKEVDGDWKAIHMQAMPLENRSFVTNHLIFEKVKDLTLEFDESNLQFELECKTEDNQNYIIEGFHLSVLNAENDGIVGDDVNESKAVPESVRVELTKAENELGQKEEGES